MKRVLQLLTCLSIIYCGCDGPYRNCPEHYFSESFMLHTSFHDGSYWIYCDTVYNVTDSIVLISQEIDYKEDCDYHGDPEQILTQSFYSSLFEPHQFLMDCRASNPVYYADDVLGFFRDDLKIGESMWFTYEAKYDSLLVNDHWYKGVMVFTAGNDHKYFWAEKVGLIKKMFPAPDNSSIVYDFEIVRYKINE